MGLDDLPPPSSLDALPPPPAVPAYGGPLANVPQDAAHPVTGELSTLLRNAIINVGSKYSDASLSMQQMYDQLRSRVTGQPENPDLQAAVEEKRRLDQPLANAPGRFLGNAMFYGP